MIRTIAGFHADDAGEWVAELSCLHAQHVRNRPPWQQRPWVLTVAGRDGRLGAEIDCALCARAELPDGLVVARTAGPFTSDTLPAAIRREHKVADRTWGLLRVTSGAVAFSLSTNPQMTVRLTAPASQPIPPGVAHAVTPEDGASVEIDFLVPPRVG